MRTSSGPRDRTQMICVTHYVCTTGASGLPIQSTPECFQKNIFGQVETGGAGKSEPGNRLEFRGLNRRACHGTNLAGFMRQTVFGSTNGGNCAPWQIMWK